MKNIIKVKTTKVSIIGSCNHKINQDESYLHYSKYGNAICKKCARRVIKKELTPLFRVLAEFKEMSIEDSFFFGGIGSEIVHERSKKKI